MRSSPYVRLPQNTLAQPDLPHLCLLSGTIVGISIIIVSTVHQNFLWLKHCVWPAQVGKTELARTRFADDNKLKPFASCHSDLALELLFFEICVAWLTLVSSVGWQFFRLH